MRILGIDPGLNNCGWGIVDLNGSKLNYVAHGVIQPQKKDISLARRLAQIDHGLMDAILAFKPSEAAVEETFMNTNPASALKLGQARGVALLTPARAGLEVFEYGANHIKKSIVGAGHAGKDQMLMMINTLLPNANVVSADAADALAVAITHAHHAGSNNAYQRAMEQV